MSVREFYIDPEFDTVIALLSPCVDFAPWEKVKKEETNDGWSNRSTFGKKTVKGVKKKSTKILSKIQNDSDADVPANVGMSLFGGSTTSVTSREAGHTNDGPFLSKENERTDPEEVARYYVSSHHLITASPWFQRMLAKDKWNESKRDKKDGLFHLSADDWDIDAFLMLLNIFHLKNRKVPRKLSLDELAKIAVLIDYYECAEAIELYSEMWIEDLVKVVPVPSTYCRTLVLWIWIAWIFDREQEFKCATLVAIKQCSEPIRTLGLPIPGRVSDDIDTKRYEAIEQIIEGLHNLRDQYESLLYKCPMSPQRSLDCGSLLYGAITKGMLAINVMSPRPEIPFKDMNFEKLCVDVRKIESPKWHDDFARNNYGYSSNASRKCHLTSVVSNAVDLVDITVTGLDLWSLK